MLQTKPKKSYYGECVCIFYCSQCSNCYDALYHDGTLSRWVLSRWVLSQWVLSQCNFMLFSLKPSKIVLKPSKTHTQKKRRKNPTLLRCVAESNRPCWFCRPETKPLIQRTILEILFCGFFFASAKVLLFSQ